MYICTIWYMYEFRELSHLWDRNYTYMHEYMQAYIHTYLQLPFDQVKNQLLTCFLLLSISTASWAAAFFASCFDLPSACGNSFPSIITWNVNLIKKRAFTTYYAVCNSPKDKHSGLHCPTNTYQDSNNNVFLKQGEVCNFFLFFFLSSSCYLFTVPRCITQAGLKLSTILLLQLLKC